MHKTLKLIYERGILDIWSDDLIASETEKVHSTIKSVTNSLTQIIVSPNSTKEQKDKAQKTINELLGLE